MSICVVGMRIRSGVCKTGCYFFIASLLSGMAFSQAPSGGTSEAAGPPLSYAVAAIHASRPDEKTSGINEDGDMLIVNNASLRDMLAEAYGIRPDLIKNLPGWAITDHYDIRAKIDGADPDAIGKLTDAQHRSMLQALLVSRFGLKAHSETSVEQVYNLIPAKTGVKLRAAGGGGSNAEALNAKFSGVPENTLTTHFSGNTAELIGRSVTLEQVAFVLSFQLNRSVVDKTTLKGVYDIDLTWVPEANLANQEDTSGAQLFTALQEQLGLKLGAGRGPVKKIVVDDVTRPSGN